MKARVFGIILTLMLALTGCSPIVEEIPAEKTSVYTTFYPVYALTDMITEGAADLELHSLVQPQDDCLRSYELSDWDMYLLAYSADLLIAAGNGLEGFQDELEQIGETSLPLAEVLYGLEMSAFTDSDDEDSHFSGENPHIYMTVDGANRILESVAGAMSLLDEENASLYEENLVSWREKLAKIDDDIQKQTEVCRGVNAAVLHEALFYVAQDYGMNIAAWYERESGEMLYDSSLDECLTLLKEREIEVVLLEKQAPMALSDALIDAGYRVARLDVMSTFDESDGSATYVQALIENAAKAAEACNKNDN